VILPTGLVPLHITYYSFVGRFKDLIYKTGVTPISRNKLARARYRRYRYFV